MSEPLRLVLWDVDGTLVDTQHIIVEAFTMACQSLSLTPPDAATIRSGVGLSLVESVAHSLPDLSPETHVRMAEAYKEAYLVLHARPDFREDLFPGARQALEDLDAAGYLLGIATGKARRGADRFIAHHGFDGRFITIHSADEGPGKPHPRMCLDALRETGVDAANAVMIGDTTFDIQMARAAGMSAIGVSWGNHDPALLQQAGAHHVIDSFDPLLQIVDRLTA
ncbi:HAD-IA family hydrolase [Novispirillum itersonii]|uniref:HAD-IA family hydrolase n=1 Tax=Novispirillum itersonii TaxID=189 RepID=UPI00036A4B0E|nr:HAD-IA family hydrolase [Novispirillum itersonii]